MKFRELFTESSGLSREDKEIYIDHLNDEYKFNFTIPDKHEDFAIWNTKDEKRLFKAKKILDDEGADVSDVRWGRSFSTLKIMFN